MPPLTSSEMKQWQECPRGWWLSYYRQLRRQRDLPSLPNIGTLVHAGLEAYYNGEVVDPGEMVGYKTLALTEKYPELSAQLVKDAEWAQIMLEGYLEWVEETGADDGLELIGSEQSVEARLGPFMLRGKIDARLRRHHDQALLQLEHKTVQNLTEIPRYAQSAPQFLNYDLLAYLTKPDGVGTDGVILNMLRRVKRTASAHPPFYGRHEVRHNEDELRNHALHVISIGESIQGARERLDAGKDHHLVVPPSIGRGHTYSCDCAPLGAMFDDGSDVEGYLQEFYEAYDPWARYNEEAQDE